MSIGSFSSSLSGLKANQVKLAVIGNNLANLNTVGFKAGQVSFADMVSQSVAGSSPNPMQVGLGVAPSSISANFSQGGIDFTGVATHVAIQGNGFFVVGDADNRGFTRAGNFSFDQNGRLVTADGGAVQGFTAINPANGQIDAAGQPGDIVVPPGVLRPPVATALFGMVSNLDSNAAVGGVFTSSVPMYDSLGVSHTATVTFTKVANGAWNYAVSLPGQDVVGGVAGVPENIANGALTFDGDGLLATVNGGVPADLVIAAPAWANGAAPVDITWDLVTDAGLAQLTSFGAPSGTSSITQNGSPAGAINGRFIKI